MPTTQISRTRGIVFALIPVTVLVLVAETALRATGFRFEPEALQVEYAGDFSARMFQDHLSNRHFVRDPVTFWKPKPSEPPFNALGYRGQELPEEKAPGELRILAVGDSNTLGHEASWVNEIPNTIEAARVGAETLTIINAGVYGFTSYQGKQHLKRFLRYRPDVVIISFGGNDATPNALADKEYVPYVPHPIYAGFGHRVALLDLVESLAFKWTLRRSQAAPAPAPREAVNRVALDDYESALAEMIGLVRKAGAAAVLATRPMVHDYNAKNSKSPLRPYYFKTRDVAKRLDAGLVDVHAMASHSWVLFADHSHFNVEGHRFIGAAVGRALSRILSGKVRAVSRPKFRPRDEYEKAVDSVGRIASPWAPLEENLGRLLEAPAISGLSALYKSDFSSGTGDWSVVQRPRKYKDREPDAVGGAVCFEPGPTWFSLTREGLALAEDRLHLIWVEAQSRSDVALSITWTDDVFDDKDTMQSIFYGDKIEVPMRLFHVLPAGTRAVRVKAHVMRWEGDVCLRRIHLSEIDVE